MTRASDRQTIYMAGDMIARLSGFLAGGASGLRLKIDSALGDTRHIFRLCANDRATWRLEYYIGKDSARLSPNPADWERVPFRDVMQVIAGDVALLGRGTHAVILRQGETDLLIDTRGGLDHADKDVLLPALVITAQAAGPLFTKDTLLRTPKGAQAVQELDPGDLVMTRDHGAQALVNCAAHNFGDASLHVIRAGAAGNHLPMLDLILAPHHGVILRSTSVRQIFRLDEVAVPSRLLGGVSEVRSQIGYAVTFANAQIVYANGVEVEAAGQAAGSLPLQAQGRRARRLVTSLTQSGAPWVDAQPEADQLAAE